MPRNLFRLNDGRRHVLVAGGIGITPLLSMAESLERLQIPFELHYYVREQRDAAFTARWAAGFAYGTVHIHSSAEGDSVRNGLPAALHSAGDGQLYLCGPDGFMRHITQSALDLGWDAASIHKEAFAVAHSNTPSDSRSFDVVLASTGQSFQIPVQRTIASVLLDAGVNVPLSCEMGICGACLTPIMEGEADHRDEVQTDDEKRCNAHIALCCSRAKSSRLVLDM